MNMLRDLCLKKVLE